MNTVFFTKKGTKVPAISTEQMREVDRIAVEETGPNLFQMMENAGRSLAQTAISLPGKQWRKARYLILAGKGGNGGGGICAARHLANRGLDVLLLLSSESLSEVAAWQLNIYRQTKGMIVSFDRLAARPFDVIVDALIGYSLKDAPKNPVKQIIDWANGQKAIKLALDVPSGINATTGEAPGVYLKADITLTLALPKSGLTNENAGKILLADLGIPATVFERIGLD